MSAILRYSLLAFLLATPVSAQLISPGKLTAAHARYEGISNCTNCHALGQRGIEPAKCLTCHTPLRARIRADEGFHATVDADCATCHKDHFGRDFDPVRFDTGAFDHRRTGFPLVGEHRSLDCQQCHQPSFITAADVRAFKLAAGRLDETYLGVSDNCQTCHRRDNPHGAGFTAECQQCHQPTGWEQVADFDHSTTGFPLVGQHAALVCTSCHGEGADGTVSFTGTQPVCATCHRTDSPHGSQFRGQDCASCHDARTWTQAPHFNHALADFPLTGRHLRVSCASCHTQSGGRTQFEGIAHETCQSCHEDQHEGELGSDCQTCHTTASWERMSRTFAADRFDHAAATGFALVGAHLDLECATCHARSNDDNAIALTLADNPETESFPAILVEDGCQSCHRDYHTDVFADLPGGTDCESCHAPDGWLPTSFGLDRHNEETTFALTGAHLATPCFACHGGSGDPGDAPPHFDFESTTCEGCHADENPHGDQFENEAGVTVCGGCHAPDGWDLGSFDHSTTGFALTGRHAALDCQTCHTPTTDVEGRTIHQFAGLESECTACHASDSPHAGQFEGASCATCHDAEAFTVPTFDHGQTSFPLIGAHERVACGSCHRTETAPSGEPFVRFRPLGTDCADCHGDVR